MDLRVGRCLGSVRVRLGVGVSDEAAALDDLEGVRIARRTEDRPQVVALLRERLRLKCLDSVSVDVKVVCLRVFGWWLFLLLLSVGSEVCFGCRFVGLIGFRC